MPRVQRQYKGCDIIPKFDRIGLYFGNSNYPVNPVQYRKHFWEVRFPHRIAAERIRELGIANFGYCYCGTISESREYINRWHAQAGPLVMPV